MAKKQLKVNVRFIDKTGTYTKEQCKAIENSFKDDRTQEALADAMTDALKERK